MSSVKHRKKDKNHSKRDSSVASREQSPVKEDSPTPRLLTPPPKLSTQDQSKEKIAPEKEVPKAIEPTKSNEFAYKIAFYIVTLLAIITRSWMIHHPGEVVFDEVHFGKFASYYLRGEYYFDVHPPLGKLLIALIGKLVGYNGHFLFENIGDNYSENNVPYIALRLWCAICGAAVVPVAFLIMKELGVSVAGCVLGSVMLVFDTALTTQSRLILLDSMLMLFCITAIYFWVKFQTVRHKPFTLQWWFWLSMTGFGLALVLGVKLVGLFTVATVGVATLFDLWEILDIKRNQDVKIFFKHFAARALCLIVLPLVLYLVPFYIHFALLTTSGPGDAFMSLEFQETLAGNVKTAGATGTNHFLHSHEHVYPLRYDNGRVSSNGQQVNAYAHFDNNSYWQILPVDPEYFPEAVELTDEEKNRDIRYLRHESYVRLRHLTTDTYLTTHDVASPLTTTNMEITTLSYDKAAARYNDTVWKIYISEGKDKKKKIKSKKSTIIIQSAQYNVALFTSKDKLPDWGFKMQEVNGNKKLTQKANHWTIQDVQHEKIVPEKEKPKTKHTMPFLKKFFELQGLMIHHNNALTSSHPYSSSPITWPFVIRGISFWEKKEGVKQIYLIGNPIAWWLSIIGPLFYFAMWLVDRILLRRGIDDFGPAVRQWWDKSIGFMCIAWLLHWIPFFLMGRQLFLHHYMPAYIFSTIAFATLFDFLGRTFMKPLSYIPKTTPMLKWHGGQGGTKYMITVMVVILIIMGSFYYFMPFCYGTGFPDVPTLRTRKWFSTWDFQYA
ncbi:hypothetical protein HK103_002275 [Boothiomyces macroporosus]|uniref:Dolichyl-phosphate-mannose--protein mannosyltransferase n=1 Tax=Boothiomyces macroporosus TaxID=261099 RepID=A0AAD5Y2L5_9FUNG|nr:hypothetical protein HK103_002275 [Boothiomyces macroporosus]